MILLTSGKKLAIVGLRTCFQPSQQQDKAGQWRLIQCGSRALNGPESRYAVCEIEAIGILYAIQKCRHYLLGMAEFEVATDHKSLKGVFKKDLASVENVRLRRLHAATLGSERLC